MPFPFGVCPPVCLGQVSLNRKLLSPGSPPLASSTAQNTMSSIINSLPRCWVKSQHGNLSIWPLIYLVKELLKQECKNTDLTTIFCSIISQISEIRKLRHREDKMICPRPSCWEKEAPGLNSRQTTESKHWSRDSLLPLYPYVYDPHTCRPGNYTGQFNP